MYQVIKEFYDLQDATDTKSGVIYHHYQVGDTYPRKGLNPSEGRVTELAGPDNAQGRPLIQAVTGGDAGQPSEPDNEEQATEAAPVAEPPKKGKRKTGKQAAPAED